MKSTSTEDRGADTHMGGTKADRLFEVGAHPHAEKAEPGTPRDLAQKREVQRRFLVERTCTRIDRDMYVRVVAHLMKVELGAPPRVQGGERMLLESFDAHAAPR